VARRRSAILSGAPAPHTVGVRTWALMPMLQSILSCRTMPVLRARRVHERPSRSWVRRVGHLWVTPAH